MIMYRDVNMAVAALALLAAWITAPMRVHAVGPLPAPLDVRFELADGVRVEGEMTACDNQGFDGSFGRRAWVELAVSDAWRLHLRVMNQQVADDWVNLGGIMLQMRSRAAKAQSLSDRAFKR